MNQITVKQLRCGTWRVTQVIAFEVSEGKTYGGSLRIFHTPIMSEAHHIAQMWKERNYTRIAGELRQLDKPPEINVKRKHSNKRFLTLALTM